MQRNPIVLQRPAIRESALVANKVLRNTYLLLSATLAFSALTAGVAMAFSLPYP
ncbi:MAG: FtsH protease modulator YccA, partial [Gammaproteobacteria bacterium]|nr:FtsH protease modulator YccA [Gammaproteobacteria bacterium]